MLIKIKSTAFAAALLCLLVTRGAQAAGERGTVPDQARFDTNHPVKEVLSRAGVVGGIPDITHVKDEVWPGADLQAAIDNGGPGVVLLRSGTYVINDTLSMRKGVILRGTSRSGVKLSVQMWSTSKVFGIYFGPSCFYAGLENLTLQYDGTGYQPVDRSGLDNGGIYNAAFENDPYDKTNLYVGMVRMVGDNNWVSGVDVLKSGTDTVLVQGDHNTLRGILVDRCYNKGDGGNGYFDLRGDRNLVADSTIRRIRHFAVQLGARHNVVLNNTIEVDVNFHNGDDGQNLIEKNWIYRPSWHPWKCFGTGGSQYGHAPPGPGNIVFDNNTWDYVLDNSPASFWSTSYTWFTYGDPVSTSWAYPVGATYYSTKRIPAPWCAGDIGGGGQTALVTESSGTWTINADGADVWGTADDFHYTWQPLHGDGEIVVEVSSLTNSHEWAKAGVMIRETLDAGSKHAMMCVSPGNGTSFQYRSTTGGSSASVTPDDGETASTWLRLVRRGNKLTGSVRRGSQWEQVGSATISMWSQAHIGFFASSHWYSGKTTAVFRNVDVSSVLTLDKTTYTRGENIQVNFGQGPGNAEDRIAVFASGESPSANSPRLWKYVDDSQTAGDANRKGTVTLDSSSGWGWQLQPGDYYVVLLNNGGTWERSGREWFTVHYDSRSGEPPAPPAWSKVLIDATRNNGSFELLNGAPASAKATHWDSDPDGDVDSWRVWYASTGGPATAWDNSGTEVNASATHGNRIGFLQPGNAIYNPTSHTIAEGDTFTFSFKWPRAGRGALRGGLAYKDGSTWQPIADTEFGGANVRTFWRTWTVPAGHPAIGKQIAFTLSTTGNFPEVDEAVLYVTSPASDYDSDGMTDQWEMTAFGTMTRNGTGDADNDGTSDRDEFRLGLNPTDSASVFRATLSSPAGGMTISWPGKKDLTFVIERSSNLGPESWAGIHTVVPASDGIQSFTLPPPAAGRAFYRVRLLP